MKHSARFLIALSCLFLPALLHAQKDDSKYLAGAVPEVEGKVVFSKEFNVAGMSQDTIFSRVMNWMNARLAQNENNSRVVFSDKEKGQIVGTGEEWIVFSSSALSLDRTKVLYQLTANCEAGKCQFSVEKIRFNYRDGEERYTAEEWITDKYALNKAQTKLVRGLAKWRRKTVDFADDLFAGVAGALSTTIAPTAVEAKKAEAPVVTTAPSVLKEVNPDALPADAIKAENGKLVIVIGQEPFNVSMMTANAGGSLGKVNGKPTVFTILAPDQAYEAIEKAETYTVRFYPNGQTEPTVILECKKLPVAIPMEGMPRTYAGEIVKAQVKL